MKDNSGAVKIMLVLFVPKEMPTEWAHAEMQKNGFSITRPIIAACGIGEDNAPSNDMWLMQEIESGRN